MQWKQLKTLFILCFLILDVYLLILFFGQQQDESLTQTTVNELTVEERLEEEDITISANLPEEEIKESYISAEQKKFSKEEQELLANKENQQSVIINKTLIVSRFEEPISIPEGATQETISEILKSSFLLPENYTYWDWNKEMNVLVFFQKKSGRPIYYNQNGIILVFLNENNEAIFYTQTMLGEAESPGDEQLLINPMHAIKLLLEDFQLESGDEITKVELGYYTFLPQPSGEQVFAPTWTITVNEEENFYVNAREILIIPSDELEFLTDTAGTILNKVQTLSDETEIKSFVLNHLSEKLTSINRSEIE